MLIAITRTNNINIMAVYSRVSKASCATINATQSPRKIMLYRSNVLKFR